MAWVINFHKMQPLPLCATRKREVLDKTTCDRTSGRLVRRLGDDMAVCQDDTVYRPAANGQIIGCCEIPMSDHDIGRNAKHSPSS